jgi:periplasmic divalent cation tolerance protein
MTDKIVVLSSCGDEEEARRVARHLVESRLAACVQVIPGAHSFYWWQGRIEDSREWVLVAKSSRDRFPALRQELLRVHSYQTPEVVALAVVDGSPTYMDWLEREVQLR